VACGRLKREDLSAVGWKAVLSAVLRWLREEQLRGRIVKKGMVGFVGSRGGNAEVKEMGGQCICGCSFGWDQRLVQLKEEETETREGGAASLLFWPSGGRSGFGKDGFVGLGFFLCFF